MGGPPIMHSLWKLPSQIQTIKFKLEHDFDHIPNECEATPCISYKIRIIVTAGLTPTAHGNKCLQRGVFPFEFRESPESTIIRSDIVILIQDDSFQIVDVDSNERIDRMSTNINWE